MESVHILAVVDGFDYALLGYMLRQRQLDYESVHIGVCIQPLYVRKQFLFGGLFGQAEHRGAESALGATFLLVPDICLAGSVVAYQYCHQMRCAFSVSYVGSDFLCDLSAQVGRHLFSVDYRHIDLFCLVLVQQVISGPFNYGHRHAVFEYHFLV